MRRERESIFDGVSGFPFAKIIIVAITVLVGLSIFFGCWGQVNAGYRGVLLTWGAPTATLNEGFFLKIPIAQSVEMMSIQVQKHESTESAASKDLQVVSTKIAVNFNVDPNYVMDVYTRLRSDYGSRVIEPSIQESVKAATALYTADELITQRETVKNKIDEILVARLAQYHILITSVSITNFDFSESFNNAIESKVTQQQKALEAENKLREVEAQAQQQVIQAEAKKEADIAQAEGEAQAKAIQAQGDANATLARAVAQSKANILLADAQAYQIDLINQKIASSPAYIQWSWIQEWDGKLPVTVFGDENISLLLQGGLSTPPSPIQTPP
jgi:regulator of protease activity HflC (stomatin/prohibitin superfamily)